MLLKFWGFQNGKFKTTLRQDNQKTRRQDRYKAAAAWIVTEDPDMLWEYKSLVFEMNEIKEAIVRSEKE